MRASSQRQARIPAPHALQAADLARMQAFMQQLTCRLCTSLYAAAPSSRKHLALRVLYTVLLTYAGDEWIARPLAQGHWASAAALGLDLPRRETRSTSRVQDSIRQQKQRAAQLPASERFAPFCPLWSTAPFTQVWNPVCSDGLPRGC